MRDPNSECARCLGPCNQMLVLVWDWLSGCPDARMSVPEWVCGFPGAWHVLEHGVLCRWSCQQELRPAIPSVRLLRWSRNLRSAKDLRLLRLSGIFEPMHHHEQCESQGLAPKQSKTPAKHANLGGSVVFPVTIKWVPEHTPTSRSVCLATGLLLHCWWS